MNEMGKFLVIAGLLLVAVVGLAILACVALRMIIEDASKVAPRFAAALRASSSLRDKT